MKFKKVIIILISLLISILRCPNEAVAVNSDKKTIIAIIDSKINTLHLIVSRYNMSNNKLE